LKGVQDKLSAAQARLAELEKKAAKRKGKEEQREGLKTKRAEVKLEIKELADAAPDSPGAAKKGELEIEEAELGAKLKRLNNDLKTPPVPPTADIEESIAALALEEGEAQNTLNESQRELADINVEGGAAVDELAELVEKAAGFKVNPAMHEAENKILFLLKAEQAKLKASLAKLKAKNINAAAKLKSLSSAVDEKQKELADAGEKLEAVSSEVKARFDAVEEKEDAFNKLQEKVEKVNNMSLTESAAGSAGGLDGAEVAALELKLAEKEELVELVEEQQRVLLADRKALNEDLELLDNQIEAFTATRDDFDAYQIQTIQEIK
jgi:chromosome segregation ATPase